PRGRTALVLRRQVPAQEVRRAERHARRGGRRGFNERRCRVRQRNATPRAGPTAVGGWLEGRRRGTPRLVAGEGRQDEGEVRRLLPAWQVQGQAEQGEPRR